MVFLLGRGLKIDDILKDDEVLTAFLLRDAGLSESIVYQLVNAQLRLEKVKLLSLSQNSFIQSVRGVFPINSAIQLLSAGCTIFDLQKPERVSPSSFWGILRFCQATQVII